MLSRHRSLLRMLAEIFSLALIATLHLATAPTANAADASAPTLAEEAAASHKLRALTYSYGGEFITDYAKFFTANPAATKATGGAKPDIRVEPGQSTKLIAGVVKGDPADIVFMTSPGDLVPLVKAGLLPTDWQTAHKVGAVPFQTTIVFLVRKGNPRGIKDWQDLTRTGVSVIVASPMFAGSGRYSYLAAWYSQRAAGKSEAEAIAFVKTLFTVNASVTGGGRKGSTTVFVDNDSLDVLLTFETEILRLAKTYPDRFEIVRPPISVQCDFPLARLEKYNKPHGNSVLAQAFIDTLYTPEGQRLGCQHGLRSILPEISKEFANDFPPIKMVDVTKEFGPWADIMKTHFSDDGVYDKMTESD